MSSLLSLSDDALLHLCHWILPSDLVSWVLSSRRLHTLAASRRLPKHRSLARQYGEFTLDEEHPTSLLHAIWQDFHIGHYVKVLTYTNHDCWDGMGRDFSSVNQVVKNHLARCTQDLIEESPYLNAAFKSTDVDYDEFLQGDETSALGLLLTLLPNLSRLILCRNYWSPQVLWSILHGALSSELLDASGRKPILSRLRCVEVRPETGAHPSALQSLDCLALWALVPSVQTLVGRRIAGVNDEYPLGEWWPSYYDNDAMNSSATVLSLTSSIVDDVELRKVLEKTTCLKEFHYSHLNGVTTDPQNSAFYPSKMFGALVSTVGSTLQVLSCKGLAECASNDFDLLKFQV